MQGQLSGSIPSTSEGQNKEPDKLISAGDFNLSVLGTMMGGRENQNGSGFSMERWNPGSFTEPENSDSLTEPDAAVQSAL